MSANAELFPAEAVAMDSPALAWMKRTKTELAIFTHYFPEGKWMAFSHTKALELLDGHTLTEAQKTVPMELFAAYCRLLDEACTVADGEETELDAVVFVAMRHGVKLWNEQEVIDVRPAITPPFFNDEGEPGPGI